MMTKLTCRPRPGRVFPFLVAFVLAGITLLATAGTMLYLNWDKIAAQQAALEQSASESASANLASTTPAQRPRVASAPITANDRSYQHWTARDDVLVLVDYYADWCGPCRKIAPALSQLAATHGDKVVVLKVNVDQQKSLAQKARVSSIPDVRLLHAGQELERVIGGYPYGHYESLVLKHESRLPAPTANPNRPTSSEGSITPLKKDWLPPGVKPAGS